MTKNNNSIFGSRSCLSRQELIRYASGKMTEREKNKVEKHLLDCELCIEALDGILHLQDARELEKIQGDLVHRFAAASHPEKGKKLNMPLLAAAVVSCLIILSGIYLKFIHHKPDSEMTFATQKETPALLLDNKPANITDSNEPASAKQETRSALTSVTKEPALRDKEADDARASADQVTANQQSKIESSVWENKLQEPAADELSKKNVQSEERSESITMSDKKFKTDEGTSGKERTEAVSPASSRQVAIKNSKAAPANVSTGNNVSSEVYMDQNTLPVAPAEETPDFKSLSDQMKYNEVITVAGKLLSKNPELEEARFYRGVAYFQLEQSKPAMQDFEHLLMSNSVKYRDGALWYKALLLNRMEKFTEAKLILNQLASPGNAYSDRALQLLDLLREK